MEPIDTRPGLTRVPFRRGLTAWIGLVAVLALTGGVAADGYGLWTSGEPAGEHVLVVGILLGISLLMLLVLLTLGARIPQYRIDRHGVALWTADGRAAEVPWEQVRGVALTHARPQRDIDRGLGLKSYTQIEVFLDPHITPTDHPRAGDWWHEDPPSVPGASPPYLVMYAPGARRDRLDRQVEDLAPGRWLGVHERGRTTHF